MPASCGFVSNGAVLSPELANEMLAQLLDGHLVSVAGAGHGVAGDNPNGFAEVLLPFLLDEGR